MSCRRAATVPGSACHLERDENRSILVLLLRLTDGMVHDNAACTRALFGGLQKHSLTQKKYPRCRLRKEMEMSERVRAEFEKGMDTGKLCWPFPSPSLSLSLSLSVYNVLSRVRSRSWWCW